MARLLQTTECTYIQYISIIAILLRRIGQVRFRCPVEKTKDMKLITGAKLKSYRADRNRPYVATFARPLTANATENKNG